MYQVLVVIFGAIGIGLPIVVGILIIVEILHGNIDRGYLKIVGGFLIWAFFVVDISMHMENLLQPILNYENDLIFRICCATLFVLSFIVFHKVDKSLRKSREYVSALEHEVRYLRKKLKDQENDKIDEQQE